MKSLTISKDSWHYALYSSGKSKYELDHEPHNLCRYVRTILFRSFIILGVLSFILFLVAGFVTSIYCLFSGIKVPNWAGPGFGIVATLLTAVSLILLGKFLLRKIGNYFDNLSYRQSSRVVSQKVDKGPGFFSLMYRNFKDKLCYLIEFK